MRCHPSRSRPRRSRTLRTLTDGDGQRLPLTAALLVWPFVFDALFTVCRRLIRGEHVLRAHRSHLYQRLVLAGMSHRSVATLYTGLAFISTLLGAVWLLRWPGSDLVVALGAPLLFVLLLLGVGVRERRGQLD